MIRAGQITQRPAWGYLRCIKGAEQPGYEGRLAPCNISITGLSLEVLDTLRHLLA